MLYKNKKGKWDWNWRTSNNSWYGSTNPYDDSWKVGMVYKVNDTVNFQGLSYKCLEEHSSILEEPPTVTLGVKWQLQ
jgi:hypothetical protein